MRITDIQENKVDWKTVPYTDFDKDKALNYLLQDGDILFARTGATVGKSYLVSNLTEDSIYASYLIRVQTSHLILPEYIKRFFESGYYWEQISLSSVGIGQPNVNGTTLANLNIPIPPYKEQVRIVEEANSWLSIADYLDDNTGHIGKAIESARSKILDLAIHGKLVPQNPTDEPASELLKRINPKAVISCDKPHYENSQLPDGWLELPISEFCDSINGLWTGKKPPFVNVGVIRNANFTKDFRLDYSKIEYIDVESKAFAKRHLIDGDLIIEKSGGSDNNPVGRSILYEGPDGTYSYSNFTMVLRVQNRELVLSKYLYYFLMAIYIRGDMRKMQTQTTGLHNLILDSFMSIMVPIPPLQEQNKIITKIETMFLALESIATILH